MKKDKSLLTGLMIVTLLMIMPLQRMNAQIHQPFLQLPVIKEAPVIDGNINDAAWKQAAELSEFVNWSLDSYVKDKVNVYMFCDDRNLYVAFRNSDPRAEDLVKRTDAKGPRDTFLWGRHHVMVAMNLNGTNVQVMADPRGTMTDWKNSDIAWNGTWNYAAMVNKTDWTAEFAIPFSDLGVQQIAPGTDFSITLSRSYPSGESSAWHGVCNLSGTAVKCETGRWPVPVPGTNFLDFSCYNPGSSAADVSVEMELLPLNGKPEFINQAGQGPSSELQVKLSAAPLKYTETISAPAGGSKQERIPFTLPVEGSYFATVSVRSADGTLLRRSVDYWFTLEPNREKLNKLKFDVGESIASMARISAGNSAVLKDEAEALLAGIQDLQKSADHSWSTGAWNELTSKTSDISGKVARHLSRVRWNSMHNWETDYGFGVSLAHSVIKLKRDAEFPLPLTGTMDISLAGNEYESFQAAILPFGKDLADLRVEVSDLSGKSGGIISKRNIEVSLVDYNKIDWQADYVTEGKGWYPDPLIPLKGNVKISGNDVCRPVWITVYAPAGTKAGDYAGKITFTAAGMKPVTAQVNCRVWGFDLPVASHLKTHSWDDIENLAGFYNKEEYPVEWYLKFCELLLKNRMNPGSAGTDYVSKTPDSNGKYDFSKSEQVLSFCINRGLTRFTISQMKKGQYTPQEAEQAYRFIEDYAKFLKSKGWLQYGLVELWDEPTDLEWPYIKERAERLKKIDPGIRLQLFAEGGPFDFWDSSTDKYGLNNVVNIWAPVNIIESPATQAKGGEIWTYFCTLARETAPNFFIECPAIYQRSIAWYCWMYGVDGFEHWSTTEFWRNVEKGKPMDQKWPNVPWDSRTYFYFNGEGQLIYPGLDGVPYSSVRLENFRDGMEDYEYMFRLRELLAKYEDLNTPEINEMRELLKPENFLLYKYPRKIKVTLENTIRHPDRPELFIETRDRIAEAIEKLQKTPPEKKM